MRDEYEFEWDEAKSRSNARKHGLSFEAATAIWDDPMFAEAYLTGDPEDRWAAVGQVARGVYLTAVFTRRGGRIRIISARRSTKGEVDVYDRH